MGLKATMVASRERRVIPERETWASPLLTLYQLDQFPVSRWRLAAPDVSAPSAAPSASGPEEESVLVAAPTSELS
jgi:hypothetical protein